MNIQELQDTIDKLAKTKQRIQALSSESQLEDNEELSSLHSDMHRLYLTVISNADTFSVGYQTLKEKCLSKLQEDFPEEHFEFTHIVTKSSTDGYCNDPIVYLTYSITLHSETESIEFVLNTNHQLTNETKIPIINTTLFPFILSRLDFPETSSSFHQTLKKVFWEIIEENTRSIQFKSQTTLETPLSCD